MKNHKTKIVLTAVILSVLCICIVALVACHNASTPTLPDTSRPTPDDSSTPHQHSYDLEEEIPATCTTAGSKTYKCSCGDSYTEPTSNLGHDLHLAHDGNNHWQECSRCDYVTEPVAHSYGTVVSVDKQSSCTEEGIQTVKCECGATTTESVQKLNHTFTFPNKNETHHWSECSVCHTVDESTRVAHSYDITVSTTSSTCTQKGTQITRCSCGATHTEQLELASHDFTVVNKDGTHHWKECAVCHTADETSRTPHDYSIPVSTTPSTCTEAGQTVTKCSCGASHTETLKLAPHTYSKYLFDDGEHWRACVNCNAEQADTRAPHTMTEQPSRLPTCTQDGLESKLCVCGKSEENITLPA